MPRLHDAAGRIIDQAVGLRIRLRRGILGLSQDAVARRLGVSFQQLQKYENGANRIAVSRLYQLSLILKTSTDYFFEDLRQPLASEADASDRDDALDEIRDISRQGAKLLRAFERIPDKKTRQYVLALVSQLGRFED